MLELDLHGVKHMDAPILVEEFILLNNTPLRIITGNSNAMKSIVQEVCHIHNLKCEVENHWNLGALIVNE